MTRLATMTGLAIEFNTFSIVARCARTGALGVATTTGEMAVGSRVPFVRTGVGAVATQALTDPRLGPLGLGCLAGGANAQDAIAAMSVADPYIESRQLAVVDAKGGAAARTGADNSDWKGHHIGDGFVAMGNRLTSDKVVDAMTASFVTDAALALEARLMRAIEAGRDAGGQIGGQRSAAILVCDDMDYPTVDLRADDYDDPVAELRRLFDLYEPRIPYYRVRAADPTIGPFRDWRAKN
ncbi:MAG: DUF1028 domain-containing protein [Alphaproteobacteria bacterium]|nr:DUF1028 domain-containing protein [Alphaproteobacteria bacterium]